MVLSHQSTSYFASAFELSTRYSVLSTLSLPVIPCLSGQNEQKPPSSSEWWFLEFKLAVWQVVSLHNIPDGFESSSNLTFLRRRIGRSDKTVRHPHEWCCCYACRRSYPNGRHCGCGCRFQDSPCRLPYALCRQFFRQRECCR